MGPRRRLQPKKKTPTQEMQSPHNLEYDDGMQQNAKHTKQQQDLEYADEHKKVYGILPITDEPGTTKLLAMKEAEVERKRLHAEGKSHEYARKRDKYDTKHTKRQRVLETNGAHKGIYGVTPGTRYGVIGLISALCGFGFSMLL